MSLEIKLKAVENGSLCWVEDEYSFGFVHKLDPDSWFIMTRVEGKVQSFDISDDTDKVKILRRLEEVTCAEAKCTSPADLTAANIGIVIPMESFVFTELVM